MISSDPPRSIHFAIIDFYRSFNIIMDWPVEKLSQVIDI